MYARHVVACARAAFELTFYGASVAGPPNAAHAAPSYRGGSASSSARIARSRRPARRSDDRSPGRISVRKTAGSGRSPFQSRTAAWWAAFLRPRISAARPPWAGSRCSARSWARTAAARSRAAAPARRNVSRGTRRSSGAAGRAAERRSRGKCSAAREIRPGCALSASGARSSQPASVAAGQRCQGRQLRRRVPGERVRRLLDDGCDVRAPDRARVRELGGEPRA